MLVEVISQIDQWQNVPIFETGQPIVTLADIMPDRFVVSGPVPRLRQEAAQRLVVATDILQTQAGPDHKFLIFGSTRSLQTQQMLYERRLVQLMRAHPDKADDLAWLEAEAVRFVTKPSLNTNAPSPHLTGGAIDLSIVKDEVDLLMMPPGVSDWSDQAHTAYFDSPLDDQEREIRDNRELLFSCMVLAGFTNYPREYWHYDFGNQFWGALTGNHAIYGLAPQD